MSAPTGAREDLERALARVESLRHDLASLHGGLAQQQDAIDELREALQTLEGRTQRHEVGQEMARETRQQFAQLAEQIEAEASLRRDLAAQLERAVRREGEAQQVREHALEEHAQQLEDLDRRQEAIAERVLRADQHAAERANGTLDEDSLPSALAARVEALERRHDADRDAARQGGEEVARLSSLIPGLITTVEELETRARSLQADQRRLDEELANLRAVRGQEESLPDLLTQQRSMRARLEERLAALEEQLEEWRDRSTLNPADRTMHERRQAEIETRLRALEDRLEAQRQVVLDHLGREVSAREERGRRQVDAIERDLRVARELLMRLTEDSDQTEREQPL